MSSAGNASGIRCVSVAAAGVAIGGVGVVYVAVAAGDSVGIGIEGVGDVNDAVAVAAVGIVDGAGSAV